MGQGGTKEQALGKATQLGHEWAMVPLSLHHVRHNKFLINMLECVMRRSVHGPNPLALLEAQRLRAGPLACPLGHSRLSGAYSEHYEGSGSPRRNVPKGQGRRPEPMGIGESNLSRCEVRVVRVGHDGLRVVVGKWIIEVRLDDPFAVGRRCTRRGA